MNKWLRGTVWLAVLGGVTFGLLTLGGNLALGMLTRRLAQEYGVTYEKLETSTFSWGFHPSLRLQGVTIRNPPGFPDGPAIRVRELYARLYADGLWASRPRFHEVRLDVEAIHVFVNDQGEINIDLLETLFRKPRTPAPRTTAAVQPKPPVETPRPTGDIAPPPEPVEPVRPISALDHPVAVAESPGASRAPAPSVPPGPAEPATSRDIAQIDRLVLKLGTVTYDELSSPKESRQPDSRKSIDLAYEREFRNVTDLDRDVMPVLEQEVLPKTAALALDGEVRALGAEAGLDPELTEAVSDLVSDPAVVDLARQLYEAYRQQKKDKKKKK